MTKLLTAFADDRDVKTAARLISYVVKHPMALCMTTAEDNQLIAEARALLDNR